MSLDAEDPDLVPVEKAAARLGISRATLWRRVRERDLTVRTTPLNRRYKLLSWKELQRAFKPDDSLVVASGSHLPDLDYLRDHGADLEGETGIHLKIVPDEPLVARARMLAAGVIDTFSGGSGIGASIIQGENGYAAEGLGPFPLRDCYPSISNHVSSALIARSRDGLETIWDIGRGTRIADVSSAVPNMRDIYRALLAWVEVDPQHVVFVPCKSWDVAVRAVLSGDADVAYASPISAAIFEAEQPPRRLRWLDLNPEASERDREGAKRHRVVQPNLTFKQNREGVPSSLGVWGLWRVGNYSSRYVHANTQFRFAYNLAKWQSRQSQPSSVTSHDGQNALSEVSAALPEVFVPLHEGAIAYLKEQGIWTERDQARQEWNLWVLDSYIRAWRLALAIADSLRVAVSPANPKWMQLWQICKQDLPQVTGATDEEVERYLCERTKLRY